MCDRGGKIAPIGVTGGYCAIFGLAAGPTRLFPSSLLGWLTYAAESPVSRAPQPSVFRHGRLLLQPPPEPPPDASPLGARICPHSAWRTPAQHTAPGVSAVRSRASEPAAAAHPAQLQPSPAAEERYYLPALLPSKMSGNAAFPQAVSPLPAQHFLSQPPISFPGTLQDPAAKPEGMYVDADGNVVPLGFAWDPTEFEQIFPPPPPGSASSTEEPPAHPSAPAPGPVRDAKMPDTMSLAAADFDVDIRSGFCPPQAPLSQLAPFEMGPETSPADGYARWEQLLRQAQTPSTGVRLAGETVDQVVAGQQLSASMLRERARVWRHDVRSMPVVPLDETLRQNVRWVRRAHLVLAFLAHFYLHSQPGVGAVIFDRTTTDEDQVLQLEENDGKYLDRIPASVSIPWVQASKQLGLPPILTYATTTLWNWSWHPDNRQGLEGVLGGAPAQEQQRRDRAAGVTSRTSEPNVQNLGNNTDASQVPGLDVGLAINETFTGLDSERWFYLGSLRVELCGVKALELMRQSLDEIFMSDSLAAVRVSGYLQALARVIDDMTQALARMRHGCKPEDFYWAIRPWFRGSDSSVQQRGWVFEGVGQPELRFGPGADGKRDVPRRQVAGPSAGQSSLIHALDAFLDVDHAHGKVRSRSASEGVKGKETFMERMMLYMPSHHRNFLTHLRSLEWEPEEDDDDDELDSDSGEGTFTAHQRRDMAVHLEARLKAERDTSRGLPTSSSNERDHLAEQEDEGDTSALKMHPLRAFVLHRRSAHPFLAQVYDSALHALKRLRDEHVKIVTLYVIQQARRPPPAHLAVGTAAADNMTVRTPTALSASEVDQSATPKRSFLLSANSNRAKEYVHHKPAEASASEDATFEQETKSSDSTLVGTGGTPLVQFLKDCRTNTVDTMLSTDMS